MTGAGTGGAALPARRPRSRWSRTPPERPSPDFDGTLSPIVADPADARPLTGAPELLAELARSFAVVAVVSGRPAAFLVRPLGRPPGPP